MKDSQLKLSPKLNHRPYFNQPKSPISNHSKSSVTIKNNSRISNQLINSKIQVNRGPSQFSKQITDFILSNLTKNRNHQSPQLKDNVIQIQYMSNSRYIGEAIQAPNSQNKKQGLGIYYYSNKDVYFGNFQNDVFHGHGTYIFSNGEQFQGQFFQGQSVKGKFYYQNGNIYEGEYSNNNPHGYGTMMMSQKPQSQFHTGCSSFKGQWKDGKQNGPGQFENSLISVRGNWAESFINQGRIDFKNDRNNPQVHIYEGALQKNQLSGSGKYFFNNYCQYTGGFKQGHFHGKGKISYENGDYYQGPFEYGMRSGQGKYYYKNGDTYVGQFYRDRKQGNGQLKFANGNSYKGQISNDKIEGSGTYCWNQNSSNRSFEGNIQFIGQFQDGKLRSGQFYQNGKLIRKQLS